MLATDGEPVRQTIHVDGQRTVFEIRSQHPPSALFGDPDVNLFRQLATDEIPPTVNSLKAAQSVSVVISTQAANSGEAIARRFARAMGIDRLAIYAEADLTGIDLASGDTLFVGIPAQGLPRGLFPRVTTEDGENIRLGEAVVSPDQQVLFIVNRQPDHPDRLVALLQPGSPDATEEAIIKIPHYGRYSYLAFMDGRNPLKGTWENKTSPLTVRWPPPTVQERNDE